MALPSPDPPICVSSPPPPGAGGAEGLAPARVHGNAGVGASASQGVHHDLPRGALRGDWYGAGATPLHPPNPGYVSGDTTGCQAHLGVPCPVPTGSGTSKKLAKRNAAAKMLVRIHNVPMEPREGSEAEVEEDQFSMVPAGEGLMGGHGHPKTTPGGLTGDTGTPRSPWEVNRGHGHLCTPYFRVYGPPMIKVGGGSRAGGHSRVTWGGTLWIWGPWVGGLDPHGGCLNRGGGPAVSRPPCLPKGHSVGVPTAPTLLVWPHIGGP